MSRNRRRRPKADPALVAQLDVVYAELPTIDCKGLCQASCGPIVQARSVTQQELLHMQDSGGERRGRQQRQPLTCPYLTTDEAGRCSIYEARPAICRLWGIVDTPLMRCPHGCEATEMLSDRAGKMVLAFVMTIGGALTPDPMCTHLANRMIGTDLDTRRRVTIERTDEG